MTDKIIEDLIAAGAKATQGDWERVWEETPEGDYPIQKVSSWEAIGWIKDKSTGDFITQAANAREAIKALYEEVKILRAEREEQANKDIEQAGDGLLPCPCCDGIAAMHRNNSIFSGQQYPDYPNQNYGFRIECEGDCHLMTCWWHTEEQAITAWNRRTRPASNADGKDWRGLNKILRGMRARNEKGSLELTNWIAVNQSTTTIPPLAGGHRGEERKQ